MVCGAQRSAMSPLNWLQAASPRNDHDEFLAGITTWWVWDNPEPSPCKPLTNVVVAGGTGDDAWQLGVNSHPFDNEIAMVEIIGGLSEEEVTPIAVLNFWPGLDAAIAIAKEATASYYRFLGKSGGQG